MEWFDNAVVYQIYPIGYCGVPRRNPFSPAPPAGKGAILRVIGHIPELKRLGFNCVMFNPLFESTAHGYDTIDFHKVDSRLGTADDFKKVCDALHENGMKVILDAVFNHVGRDFGFFKDVRQHKHGSRYKDWFYIRDGNSSYNDGFFYEGWEGHFELVKLNLQNPAVKDYLKEAVRSWVENYDIDGLRLDVAYSLDLNFLRELRVFCKGLKSDFWLLGETLHGDYNTWMNPDMLDSVTNYECYKGLYSSFNDLNMFEIAYSLGNRQFGGSGLYKGKKLYCFVDNHDVGRIASVLKNDRHLEAIYALMFTMPGIPGVYYGSEYAIPGGKRDGDNSLRPEFIPGGEQFREIPLTRTIAKLAKAHSGLKPLYNGDYRQVVLNNQYFAFARSCDGQTVYTLINAGGNAQDFSLGDNGIYKDVISGAEFDISRSVTVPAFGAMVLYNASVQADLKLDYAAAEAKPAAPEEKSEPAVQAAHKDVKDEKQAVIDAIDTEELTKLLKEANAKIIAIAKALNIEL